MGSLAMDDAGNMALGYSACPAPTLSRPSVTPGACRRTRSVRVPGRADTSSPAAASQTHSSARWGDYSSMSFDPTDDCTFWYTQEYYSLTSSAGWQTRIGSFKFPSCTQLASGKLTGTVTDGTNPIEGAAINLTGGDGNVTAKEHGAGPVGGGAIVGGGLGLVLGLFAPPLLLATAVGAGIGAGVGELVKRHEEKQIGVDAEEWLPNGASCNRRRCRQSLS